MISSRIKGSTTTKLCTTSDMGLVHFFVGEFATAKMYFLPLAPIWKMNQLLQRRALRHLLSSSTAAAGRMSGFSRSAVIALVSIATVGVYPFASLAIP